MHSTELDFHLNATTSLDKSFRITFFIYKMGILLLTLLGCCKKEEDDARKVYFTARLAQVLSIQSTYRYFLFPFRKRKNFFPLV